MNRIQVHRVRETFGFMKPCGAALIAQVLRNLAESKPAIRALFPEDPALVSKPFFDTLGQIVRNVDRFERLEESLGELGAKAAAAGFVPKHYGVVRDELLSAMASLMGDHWTAEVEGDWTELLDAVSGAMLRGAISHRARAA